RAFSKTVNGVRRPEERRKTDANPALYQPTTATSSRCRKLVRVSALLRAFYMRNLAQLFLLPQRENTYMNALTQTIGNQIDTEARDSSQPLHLSTRKLVTLQDLLAELQHDKQIAMLRTTAGHITSFLNVPVEKVGIDGLVNIVPEFRHYLKQKRYKRNTANGYCNYAGLLLRKAKQLGWVPSNPEIPRE